MQNREFSIEDAYQIFVFFMPEFWWKFLKDIMYKEGLITKGLIPEEYEKASEKEKLKDVLYQANDFVFNIIPLDPSGCDDYFEKVIEERMGISSKEQHQGLHIKEKKLFQLVIDFCEFFKSKFKGLPNDFPKESLNFAIKWLEDMRKHPKSHINEWNIWNEAISDVIEKGQRASSFF